MRTRHLDVRCQEGQVKRFPCPNDRGQNDEKQEKASWCAARSRQERADEASQRPGAVNSELAAGHLPSNLTLPFQGARRWPWPCERDPSGQGVPKA